MFKGGAPVQGGGTIETTLEYLPTLIEKNFFTQEKELEEVVAKKMAEVKYSHSKCSELVKKIKGKDLEGKQNERFNRAAATSKAQLETQLTRLLEKIDPKNRASTLEDARAYSGEGYVLLLKEINFFRKNIIYTSVYLKEEMKEIGETLQEIMNNLFALNKAFEEKKDLFEFEKTQERLQKIKKLFSALAENSREKEKLLQGVDAEEFSLGEKSKKVSAIKEGEEMLSIKSLEEEKSKVMAEKQELKSEVSSLLSTIDRPLQRFKQLVDSERISLPKEEKEFLGALTTNPMIALKGDPKAVILKQILVKIKKAIEEGKIELKDKEREKRIAALDEIMAFNFFEKVFWKLNEIQKRQIELDQKIEDSFARKALEKEEGRVKESEKSIFSLREKISELDKAKENLLAEIEGEKKSVVEFSSRALGKTIILKEEK